MCIQEAAQVPQEEVPLASPLPVDVAAAAAAGRGRRSPAMRPNEMVGPLCD